MNGTARTKTKLVLVQKRIGQNVVKKFIMDETLKKFRRERKKRNWTVVKDQFGIACFKDQSDIRNLPVSWNTTTKKRKRMNRVTSWEETESIEPFSILLEILLGSDDVLLRRERAY